MGHEERKRSATAAGLGLVGAYFAMRSLDEEYAAMVLKVWDEQMAEDKGSPRGHGPPFRLRDPSQPDATRPAAHAERAARLIREALVILSGKPSE